MDRQGLYAYRVLVGKLFKKQSHGRVKGDRKMVLSHDKSDDRRVLD
jgi:hypothetical protein